MNWTVTSRAKVPVSHFRNRRDSCTIFRNVAQHSGRLNLSDIHCSVVQFGFCKALCQQVEFVPQDLVRFKQHMRPVWLGTAVQATGCRSCISATHVNAHCLALGRTGLFSFHARQTRVDNSQKQPTIGSKSWSQFAIACRFTKRDVPAIYTSNPIRPCVMKPFHEILTLSYILIFTLTRLITADLSFVTYPSSLITDDTYKIGWQGADGNVRIPGWEVSPID